MLKEDVVGNASRMEVHMRKGLDMLQVRPSRTRAPATRAPVHRQGTLASLAAAAPSATPSATPSALRLPLLLSLLLPLPSITPSATPSSTPFYHSVYHSVYHFFYHSVYHSFAALMAHTLPPRHLRHFNAHLC